MNKVIGAAGRTDRDGEGLQERADRLPWNITAIVE
jgi:hypothetical protein